MIYLGRFFVSMYVLPTYSPITPRDSICIPLTKQIMQVVLAHPETVFPARLPATAQMIPRKLIAATSNPMEVMIRIGLMDRLVIPSKARANIFFSG